jgi:5-formyltetrahydrofolate cyclo-ligase
MPSETELKAQLRQQVLARRDALDEVDRIEMSLQAAHHGLSAKAFDCQTFLPGTIVSGFFPIRSEIDPRPLLFELAARGARLCLPAVKSKTIIEFRELSRDSTLMSCGFGTVGPDLSAAVLDPQILIMPLSVFDGRGGRIGYGAGYYDRAIERLVGKAAAPQLLGMAFSLQEVDRVPMAAHDRFLGGIITENEYRDFQV